MYAVTHWRRDHRQIASGEKRTCCASIQLVDALQSLIGTTATPLHDTLLDHRPYELWLG